MLPVQAGMMIVIFSYFSLAVAILMGRVKNDVGKMQMSMFSLTEAITVIGDLETIVPSGLALEDIDFELVTVTELLFLPTDFFKYASNKQLLQLKSKYPMQGLAVAHVKEFVMAEIAARNLQEAPKALNEPSICVNSWVKKVKSPKSPLVVRKEKKKSRENSWTRMPDTWAAGNRRPSSLEGSTINRIFTSPPTMTFSEYPVGVENNTEMAEAFHESRVDSARWANPRTKTRRSSNSLIRGFKDMEIGGDVQFESMQVGDDLQSESKRTRGDLQSESRKIEGKSQYKSRKLGGESQFESRKIEGDLHYKSRKMCEPQFKSGNLGELQFELEI